MEIAKQSVKEMTIKKHNFEVFLISLSGDAI